MNSCMEEAILQAYIDGELAREASISHAAHLAVCDACAARVGEAQRAGRAADLALATVFPGEIPTVRLRTLIDAKIAVRPVSRSGLIRRNVWKLAGAVAATALAVIFMFPWRPVEKAPKNQEKVLTLPEYPLASQTASASSPIPRQLVKTNNRVVRRVATVEIAPSPTPFYSLIEDGELAPLESGRVVRVEVPAQTLIKFGLPVVAEALTQPVEADLLMGDDGLARAIRFIPTAPSIKTK